MRTIRVGAEASRALRPRLRRMPTGLIRNEFLVQRRSTARPTPAEKDGRVGPKACLNDADSTNNKLKSLIFTRIGESGGAAPPAAKPILPPESNA